MRIEYYMTRPEELAKHAELCRAKGEPVDPLGALTYLHEMAGTNDDVFNVMWSFWNFEHAWDDLLDESAFGPEVKLAAMQALHDAVVFALLPGNEWNVGAECADPFWKAWTLLVDHCGWSELRKELAEKARQAFFCDLWRNPFVRQHRHELRALFVQAMLRGIAGDEMAASAKAERRALAPAVRCGDVDVMIHLVYLARGWVAACEWSSRRDYDLPDAAVSQREGG